MKVLIPFEIPEINSSKQNPFIPELVFSLKFNGCDIDTGVSFLDSDIKDWDIVNFQWPEYILPFCGVKNDPIGWLRNRLLLIKKKSKIVITIHNLLPHRDKSDFSRSVYSLLYELADGFIHFSEKSIDIIQQKFHAQVINKKHTVIPHGNYSIYGPKVSKAEAKKFFGLQDKPSFLFMGAIRHKEEYKLIKLASKCVKNAGADSLQAYRISIFDRKLFKESISNKVKFHISKFWINKSKKNIIYASGIPFNMMSKLLSATDVLFIPRINSLNSGLVQLGFTYGCVVLGSEFGNIGDQLKQTNNPTFNYSNLSEDYFQGVINKAVNLSNSNLGSNNLNFAHCNLDWNIIGKKYKLFYEELIKNDA